MSNLLPYEQTKNWEAIECATVARDLASLRSNQTRRDRTTTELLDVAVDALTRALRRLKAAETNEEFYARCERELDVLEQDAPSISEMFAWGDRYCVLGFTMEGAPPDIRNRGYVIGHTTGWYDFGGPESGPGPVEEVGLVQLKCDDGRTRAVYPGNLDHEKYAEENIAMWETP